ncbi:TRAP transporter small permease [Oceanispirochaeta crateris]|uniref:TRAP transporter small permease n=2 Tax=Oceanispirochaeta crateris TaxID=2518645 RepID=A0A5C1QH13_9SPIO|nr:TRAP transporter small permease [Oceanispirochaeta crateris]
MRMDKFIDILYEKIVGNLIKVIGLIMTLSILIQIFSRAFMKVPFSWTEELSRIMFMWFCFLGSGLALKKKAHLGIDFFVNKYGQNFKYVNQIIINLLVGFFGFFMAFYGFKIARVMHKQVSSVMRIPMSYYYAVIPVTGILLLILSIYYLIQNFKKENRS